MHTNEIDAQRVALVTGAGTGIGRAVALEFLAQGYRVVLAGRRRELRGNAHGGGRRRRARAGDADGCVRRACGADLFDAAQREYGRLDVLFNNAGRGAPAVPIEELSVDVWRDVVNTNLTGMFLCAQAAIRVMKSQTPRASSTTARSRRMRRAVLHRLYGHQARGDWPDQVDFAGLPALWHRLRPDRHRQRGDRHDRAHGRWHPAGRRQQRWSRAWTWPTSRRPWPRWRACRWTPTCSS